MYPITYWGNYEYEAHKEILDKLMKLVPLDFILIPTSGHIMLLIGDRAYYSRSEILRAIDRYAALDTAGLMEEEGK